MAVVVADVRAFAPEFRDTVAVPDSEVLSALTDAQAEVNYDAWGTAGNRGVKLLTAHYLAVAHPELSQAQKIRVYETPGAEDAGALGTTRWGAEYKLLRDSQLNNRLPVVGSAGTFTF